MEANKSNKKKKRKKRKKKEKQKTDGIEKDNKIFGNKILKNNIGWVFR